MNINFNDSTFEKLHFLANLEGRSVAAFVSMRMDELVGQLVNTKYTVNELPEGVVPAHLDPTPRPAPARPADFVDYPGTNLTGYGLRDDPAQRRYEEERN